MNFKRFNGSTWDAIHHKTYDTMTESLTSFPAMIQASGDPLTDYTIYGNTGGVGERTKNLYDKSVFTPINGFSDNSGKWTTPVISFISVIMPCEPNTSYVISKMITNRQRISTYPTYPANGDIALQVEKDGDYNAWSDIITDANAHYMVILLLYDDGTTGWMDKLQEIIDSLQVEIGTQPTSYEPYGYKIPVTSGGVTTTLYTYTQLGLTDALTYTDTGIVLPTAAGNSVISFGTTVQPSAMDATFKGWHPVQAAKVYDGSEWR